MGVTLMLTSSIIFIILISGYLKVLYDSVRKVRIAKSYKLPKKTADIKEKNANGTPVSESKILKETLLFNEYKQAPGPLPWPVLGNLDLLGRYESPFQAFTELAKKYGDTYSLTLGTTRCLIVNNLDPIREVLNQNGKFFGGRPDFIRFHILFGGNRNNSLALCDWSQLQQRRRNLARKHCSPRDTSSFYIKMSNVGSIEIQELMHRLNNLVQGNAKPLALKPLLQQTCANMFCRYMSSVRFDYDDVEFQNIVRCFDEIFWEINQGYAVDFLPWLKPFYASHLKRITYWSETIRKFILNRIIRNRECDIRSDLPEKDFTDALLKSLSESEGLTRETLIYMLEDFIGGHSAIGNLVMLALAHIVKNPETGIQIQAEIDKLLEQSHREITLLDTEKMPYTMSTIYEVLRFCSSPIVPHVATEDVTISGYGVTKGTVVFINNYELNTSHKYWDNPQKFDPSRFLAPLNPQKGNLLSKNEKDVQLKKNIPHFIPFSIGKRTCVGQNLVRGFGFILLANILHRYDVSSDDISQIKTYTACVAVPPDTFSLILTPRKIWQKTAATIDSKE